LSYSRISHGGGAVPTTLAGDISSGATALNLAASAGWPDGLTAPFFLVIDQGLANEEKMLATTRTGLTLNSLTRGVDGTTASAHSSGAQIVHCFTATEADEANVTAHTTLGAITTKGDSLWGTGAQAVGRQGAGADNTVVIYDSTQPNGVKAGKVSSVNIVAGTITATELAANAVTTAKIVDGAVTAAKIDTTNLYHFGTYSGSTDGQGRAQISHGAPFTPSIILFSPFSPNNVGVANVVISGTTVQFWHTSATSLTVSGVYLCFP